MALTTLARWHTTCEACGFAGSSRDYRRIIRAWSSWGRHYHTLAHLDACLKEFDGVRNLALRPGEVELALWFHDAVYSTRRFDNEARSATFAAGLMARGGAESTAVERVRAAILATRHRDAEPTDDAALVVDIDLSILGQSALVYQEFEHNVRREYWWVPRRRYVAGRCAILKSFLDRTAIYRLSDFRARYEARARLNLVSAIEDLQG
jgi:predicted metal-dependent HD superfamily phosphohydrolase